MTITITDAFDLPRPEDIRAMGFVVKLRESDPGSDEVKQLVGDYVITPAVEKELPRILDAALDAEVLLALHDCFERPS